MSAVKTLAWSVIVWGLLGTLAHADPLYSNGGSSSWSGTFWLPGANPDGSGSSSTGLTYTTSTYTPPPPPPQFKAAAPVAAPASDSPPSTTSTASAIPTTAAYSLPVTTPPPAQTPPSTAPAPLPAGTTADGFINFGTSSFPEASVLLTGNPQPWYTSPTVEKFFGGQQPNDQQQIDFKNAVLQDVKTTFQLSGGLAPVLTINPSDKANHTLSIVSGASYGPNQNAIGITDVGNNGFGFIDKLNQAQSLTDLEWAVAHNVSHELMHAFGVSVHHDQTGQYLDAATASWSMLTDPNTTFSQATIDDIRSRRYTPIPTGYLGPQMIDGDLEILNPVPEPTTVALWGVAATVALLGRRRTLRLAAAKTLACRRNAA